MIEISGKEFPLIFSFDAIASVEAEYDLSILDVQQDMGRIDKIYTMLAAALPEEFTKEKLAKEKLPPVLVLQGLIQEALYVAYFGTEAPKDEPKTKKKTKKK